MKTFFKSAEDLKKEASKGATNWEDVKPDVSKIEVGQKITVAVKFNGFHEYLALDVIMLGNPVLGIATETPKHIYNVVKGQALSVPHDMILKVSDE